MNKGILIKCATPQKVGQAANADEHSFVLVWLKSKAFLDLKRTSTTPLQRRGVVT
jgi:hypothetical protein